ncbi:uncharacterized protein LOC143890023 isoform X2 [Tasmannia lanceolata]|uniref:uncharacterized protein LOC143890023 isoform X2 n=1 Tax=Tasmannia lanceolata TaxID=3420 RepID=UPI004063580E
MNTVMIHSTTQLNIRPLPCTMQSSVGISMVIFVLMMQLTLLRMMRTLVRTMRTKFLPPKFVREAEALVDPSIFLEDTSGGRWRVNLSILDGSLALQNGWGKFVSDHSIKFGEILVFNYIVGSHFVVKIYGTSGCERLGHSISNNDDHSKGKGTVTNRKRKGKRPMAEPSPDCSPSLKNGPFSNGMVPSNMVDKGLIKQKEGLRRKAANFKLSESELIETATEKSSQCGCSLKRTSDAIETKCYSVDGDTVNEGATKCRATPSNSSDIEMVESKCSDEDIDKVNATTPPCNLSHFEMIGNNHSGGKRDSEDIEKLHSSKESNVHHGSGANKNGDDPDVQCHIIDGESMGEEGDGRNGISPNLSDFEGKSDAETMVKLPTSTEKASHHGSCSKRTLNSLEVPCYISDDDSMNEEGDFNLIDNNCEVPKREKSFHQKYSSKRKFDALQVPCNLSGKDLNEEAVESRTIPFNLYDVEIIESKCNAENGDKIVASKGKYSHFDNSSERISDPSEEKYHVIEDTMDEEGTAKIRTNPNSSHLEAVVEVPIVTIKNSNSSDRLISSSDASEVPCSMIEKDSVIKEDPSRSRTDPSNLMIERKCDGKLPGTTEKSSDYDNNFGVPNTASLDFTGNDKRNPNISHWNIYNDPPHEKGKCASIGNRMVKMEYASGAGRSASQNVKNVCEAHEYPLTTEDKYCYSEKELDLVLEKNERHKNCSSKDVPVKVENDESIDSFDLPSANLLAFSCSVSMSTQSHLVLPIRLPPSLTKKRQRQDRMVVFLRDPAMRMWPILYHGTSRYNCLAFGWSTFVKANNIQLGDVCVFEVESGPDDMFLQVRITKGPQSSEENP